MPTYTIKEIYIVFDDDGKMTGASVTPLVRTDYPDGTFKRELGAQIPLRTFAGEQVNSGLDPSMIGDLYKTLQALDIQATGQLDAVQVKVDELTTQLQDANNRASEGEVRANSLGGQLEAAQTLAAAAEAALRDLQVTVTAPRDEKAAGGAPSPVDGVTTTGP